MEEEEEEEEERQQAARRATRSSCAAASNGGVERSAIAPLYNPTVGDLAFGGEPLSSNDLLSRFPARRAQILELVRLLGPSNSPMFPLFVYGGASTGKTTIIVEVFRHLNRPFVYASCRTCYTPRILFESILNQLLLHRKNEANSYSSAKRCERPSDFVSFLREGVGNVVDNLKDHSGKRKSGRRSPKGNVLYMIIDNLELVREWDRSSSLLPFLFNLYDIIKLPNFALIYVSSSSPDTYCSSMGYIEPIPVFFPEYTEEDLRQILIRNQATQKLYGCFLDIVLPPFCRVTRRLDELSTVFSSLFQNYCEPLSNTSSFPNDEMKRILFSRFRPYISPALNEIYWGPSKRLVGTESWEVARQRDGTRRIEDSEDLTEIGFHMSTASKYLLISAFLASRNPATLDASLFDTTGGSDNHKRKRKASEKSMEQKETAEQESLMKGPGTFPLERLLAIFECITEVSIDEEELADGFSTEGGGSSRLVCNVLLQLSSLCDANFIAKGGSCCPLEGSTRYRCIISEDLALKVARSIKFALPNYLCRR